MNQKTAGNNFKKKPYMHHRFQPDKFYAVEFMIDGFPHLFQFKIWNTPSKPLFILVRESSEIASHLKKGDIIKVKYYSTVSDYPTKLETEIEYITKEELGRIKGYFLVGLKILPDQETLASF